MFASQVERTMFLLQCSKQHNTGRVRMFNTSHIRYTVKYKRHNSKFTCYGHAIPSPELSDYVHQLRSTAHAVVEITIDKAATEAAQ